MSEINSIRNTKGKAFFQSPIRRFLFPPALNYSSSPKISFKVASRFPPANSDDFIGNPQSRMSASSKLLFTIRSVNIFVSYPGPPGLHTNKHGFHRYSGRWTVASAFRTVIRSWTAAPYRKSVPVRILVRGTDFRSKFLSERYVALILVRTRTWYGT